MVETLQQQHRRHVVRFCRCYQRSPSFRTGMSSIDPFPRGPQPSQPHPDPALLNSTPPTASNVVDDTAKINVVSPEFKTHPATQTSEARRRIYGDNDNDSDDEDPRPSRNKKSNRRLKEVEAESLYLWEVTKQYLFRPGVAGGLIGLGTSLHPLVSSLTLMKHPCQSTSASSPAQVALSTLNPISVVTGPLYRQRWQPLLLFCLWRAMQPKSTANLPVARPKHAAPKKRAL